MSRNEHTRNNQPMGLDEMKRLWSRQSQALEGRSLIDDEAIRKAMRSTRRPAVPTVNMWRRAAAVAAVLVVAAVAVWRWPAPTGGRSDRGVAGTVAEATPNRGTTVVPAPVAAAAPVQQVTRIVPEKVARHALPEPAVGRQVVRPLSEVEAPALQAAPHIEESAHGVPAGVEEWPRVEMAVAQAAPPHCLEVPNRRAAADTLTVYSTGLVQYDTPRRKSLAETLFEPVLASL